MSNRALLVGGGTMSYVRNHLALAAPAFGNTARGMYSLCLYGDLLLTKMANHNSEIVTSEDLYNKTCTCLDTGLYEWLFWNPAIVDYDGDVEGVSGKYAERLRSRDGEQVVTMRPADKLLGRLIRDYPNVKIIAFKTVCGGGPDAYEETLVNIGKTMKCHMTFVNDVEHSRNCIVHKSSVRTEGNRERLLRKIAKIMNGGVRKQMEDPFFPGDALMR